MKRFILVLTALCMMTTPILEISVSASCSHSSLGTQYCDASHPHAYFKYCNTCNAKVYTGGNATKTHGDGTWGSGTCPNCGVHKYVGRTCTNIGKCACGKQIVAYGHSLGVQYCDASHPHAYFKNCNRCSAKIYTGGYTTKKHGDGAWGSGTCKSCGSHNYSTLRRTQSSHPHTATYQCVCGNTQNKYPLDLFCSSCSANSRTVTSVATDGTVFSYIDGDGGWATVIFVPVVCYVEYTNTYNNPKANYIIDY